ncbi:hypothetical protein ACOSP7_004525 [Xanthoceras sorbifolium]
MYAAAIDCVDRLLFTELYRHVRYLLLVPPPSQQAPEPWSFSKEVSLISKCHQERQDPTSFDCLHPSDFLKYFNKELGRQTHENHIFPSFSLTYFIIWSFKKNRKWLKHENKEQTKNSLQKKKKKKQRTCIPSTPRNALYKQHFKYFT